MDQALFCGKVRADGRDGERAQSKVRGVLECFKIRWRKTVLTPAALR